ncbi:MAG: hypothetical protein JW909_05360 [Planctomycetes bacterium]|nr:hypothetical protein [Planctomycetota bacterium]
MKNLFVVGILGALLCGCSVGGPGLSAAAAPLSDALVCADGTPSGALAAAQSTELYRPVSVGLIYAMPMDDLLTDAVGIDVGITWRWDFSWDVEFTAGYIRYEWENGVTMSQTFPVMATVRYTELLMSGASWYMGVGVGYSLNDPTDMENSIAGKVTLGAVQPVQTERMLVGVEAAYYYSKADRKWGGGELDLSGLQARIAFTYNF